MSTGPGSVSQRVWRYSGGGASRVDDRVAVEEPLEVRVNGRAVCITMRTPGADRELAAGFLLSERVVSRAADIGHVSTEAAAGGGDAVDVRLVDEAGVQWMHLQRRVVTGSSCGLCGSADIVSVVRACAAVAGGQQVAAATLLGMPAVMRRAQAAFDQTGGLHGAALFDLGGGMLCCREDIGRHNAVDKVVGWALLGGMLPLSGAVLCVSGRVSFEIVLKAATAGVPIIAAVSAPSSMAIDLAERCNITLAGFVRGEAFNIYTHPGRVTGVAGA